MTVSPENHERIGVLRMCPNGNGSQGSAESEYIKQHMINEAMHYARQQALMTMIEHTSRQNMLEKQNARQKELEAIRAKETEQQSANASAAVKRHLQEVILAKRKMIPTNGEDFPLRKTMSEPNLKLRSKLRTKVDRRHSPMLTRKTGANEIINERIRRKISATESPKSASPNSTSSSQIFPSTSSSAAVAGTCPSSGMFSSPSLPNIADIASGHPAHCPSQSPNRKTSHDESNMASKSPYLIQALLASQVERNRFYRANSVPTLGEDIKNWANSRRDPSQYSASFGPHTGFGMAGPSADMNNFRQKQQMIPSMSQLSLNSNRFQIERSARLNSYQTPFERRTGFFAERNDKNVESFENIFWKMAERSLLDEIEPRLPNKDELRLVHSEKLISSKFSVSPLAMEKRESSQFHSLSGIVDITVAVGVDQLRNGFAFVNNSGTQAEKDFSHDFPFNSIAIAIRSLLEQRPNFRLFVFDLGEHHATGTQSIFYSDPNVLTVSFHRNQGSLERAEEIGRGTGLGYNLNVPLPENLSDDDMKVVADVILLPLMVEFEPEIVIVNTNFSSYFEKTSPELYGWLMGEISQIAAQKVVVVFNGLQNSILTARIALNMLLSVQQKEAFQKLKRKPFLREPVRETITSIIQTQSKYWPCLQRSRLFLEQLIDSSQEIESDDENIKVD